MGNSASKTPAIFIDNTLSNLAYITLKNIAQS
jgi:hypothetical protein